MRMERRIGRLGTFFAVVLVLVSLRVVYWQLIRGPELQPVVVNLLAGVNRTDKSDLAMQRTIQMLAGNTEAINLENLPQPVVMRTAEVLQRIERGAIYDQDGVLLAYDARQPDGSRRRVYTDPAYAHVIGYVSGLRTGITGLELTYNATLLGLNRVDTQVGQLIHQPILGTDLVLTLDSEVQRLADQVLEGRAGAVVVLDGTTGAVLAMASGPRFDPNRVYEAGYLASLQGCGTLACQGPFLNRATQAVYTPGSTWKTVTLIAALDTEQVSQETVFDFGPRINGPNGSYYIYEVDGGIIPDPNHAEARLSLEMSYAKSANAAFARMGAEMRPDVFIEYAERLGFGSGEELLFPLELPYTPSQVASDVDSLRTNNLLRAATAIGQGELLASPLNMAMVVLAVLNEGDMPVPYLVQSTHAPGSNRLARPDNRHVERNIMEPETAALVRVMMLTAARTSGQRALVEGLTIGGKTGTAQLGGDLAPHAWFIGFAEDGENSVVIAVVVENAGQGSQVAAPIFAQMASLALSRMSEPIEAGDLEAIPGALSPPPLE